MPSIKNTLHALDKQTLSSLKIGLEKESLRITENGRLSRTSHPAALGAPLTHPFITTDYAEALLEFITPPSHSSSEALDFLNITESFVHQHLNNEYLWSASMPCTLESEQDINIAYYGHSNIGKMKTLYRTGLGHRYGKSMQVIAGVHFNFSFSSSLWQQLYHLNQCKQPLHTFKNESYMGMIRNIQRYGWLIIYLMGASPAICKSFVKGVPTNLLPFDKKTFYEPYATSLRMGDIGYTNSREGNSGLRISYNSLNNYLRSMHHAINQHCPEYEKIGLIKHGVYQQLNNNILQIENEHYSTVRPKQILQELEKPIDALNMRGIEYIELRSIDINPYNPLGISQEQLNFIEVFMSYCLFQSSPLLTPFDIQNINYNQSLVAHQGRKPGLQLQEWGQTVTMTDRAHTLFDHLYPVAEKLDQAHGSSRYTKTVTKHHEMINDSELTPSANILSDMHHNKESFIEFNLNKSHQHRDYFLNKRLSKEQFNIYRKLSQESIQKQTDLEKKDMMSFEQFLKRYHNSEKKLYKQTVKEDRFNRLLA
ncbi:MAG: glutamate--cysteine ligase [Gammaproteobacteria bacterium]|nr:glutamate--cysteine ligase [Gammaproteobacteria bacterium]